MRKGGVSLNMQMVVKSRGSMAIVTAGEDGSK